MGDIFIALCKTANEAAIIDIIAKREMKLREIEQEDLRAIEEEKRKSLLQLEEQNRRKKRLMENIERQMEGWFMSQKLRKYAEELEAYASETDDETIKEHLAAYIALVYQKAEACSPLADFLNEAKAIVVKDVADSLEGPQD